MNHGHACRKEIVIELGAGGAIHVDGRTLELAELKNMVRDSAADAESPPTVVLRVDPECAFRHVAAVQTACEDAGLPEVHFRSY
jgi:biopolymer transport protein ExbD